MAVKKEARPAVESKRASVNEDEWIVSHRRKVREELAFCFFCAALVLGIPPIIGFGLGAVS